MSERVRHPAYRYLGTESDRSGMTPAIQTGTIFVETDAGGVWFWNGTDWVTGSLYWNLRTETANYTATTEDNVIVVDATGGNVQVTLPDANGVEGKVYVVKRTDGSANTVTVVGTGGDTIDDQATQTLNQYDAMMVVSDDAEYWII